jgi:hypothetical protein
MAKPRKTSSPAETNFPSAGSQPTRDQIALRAYEIYLERGCEPGHELEDWTQAERELSAKNGKSRRKISPKSIAA